MDPLQHPVFQQITKEEYEQIVCVRLFVESNVMKKRI